MGTKVTEFRTPAEEPENPEMRFQAAQTDSENQKPEFRLTKQSPRTPARRLHTAALHFQAVQAEDASWGTVQRSSQDSSLHAHQPNFTRSAQNIKNRIILEIDDQCTSWIEVETGAAQNPGMRQTAAKGTTDIVAKLDDALALVKSFANKANTALSEIGNACQPDEASVSLSLSFDAKAGGWGLAEISAGGQIQVTIGWKKAGRSE